MQEHTTIPISSTLVNAIKGDDSHSATLILQELNSHVKAITDILTTYHWAERGAVNGVTIEPGSVSINTAGQGSFIVKYDTNIHYGCSDKDIELNNSMRIAINADLNIGTAILTGENIVEREPDGF